MKQRECPIEGSRVRAFGRCRDFVDVGESLNQCDKSPPPLFKRPTLGEGNAIADS